MRRRKDAIRRKLTSSRLGKAESSSEPNLGNTSSRQRLPLSITVDELHLYRRRKVSDAPGNNLYLEYGSLKDIATEYQSCFKAPPIECYSPRNVMARSDELKENMALNRLSNQLHNTMKKENSDLDLANSKWYRPSREQSLKLEGEMLFQTENRDEFIEYVLGKRRDLLRRHTELKLEGDIETMTENREKFVAYDKFERPPLAKRNTNLHLEGDHLYVPEYREFFVEFPRKRPTVKRPSGRLRVDPDAKMNTDSETLSRFVQHILNGNKSEILRRPANLRCEGDIALMPEYRESFREYPPVERRYAIKKLPTLKLEGQLYTTPEYTDKFVTFNQLSRIKPIKRYDSLQLGDDNAIILPKLTNANTENLSSLTVSTDNNTAKPPTPTKTKPLEIHKSNASSYDHTAITLKKYSPTTTTTTHNKTKMTQSNAPTEENLTGKPPRASRSRAPSRASTKRDIQLRRTPTRPPPPLPPPEVDLNMNPSEPPPVNYWIKQPSNRVFEIDKSLETKPEYRKAYLDYLIREKVPKRGSQDIEEKKMTKYDQKPTIIEPSREDRKLSASNNNLLNYPPATRRGSASSILSSPRRRSSSPAYRMQVTNVDEPKRGFGKTMERERERSREPPSLEYVSQGDGFKTSNRANWIKSIVQHKDDFGYQDRYREGGRNEKSFVILDNEREVPQTRRKWESSWWRNTLES